jgi:hypothetical protein
MTITTPFYIKHKESKEISLENNYYSLGENQILVLEMYLSVHNYAIQYSQLPSQSVQTILLQGQTAQGNANNSIFKSLEVNVRLCIARFDI